jgi:HPt (histidine-containing phosphotransfer) domain-containing protein
VLQIEFEQRILQFRQNYLNGLPEKAREIGDLIDRIENGDNDLPALQDLQSELHRVRGVAPTFGFHELGEAAAEAEDAIRQCLAGKMLFGHHEVLPVMVAVHRAMQGLIEDA